MLKNPVFLKNLYLALFAIIFVIIFTTPLFVRAGISIIDEETLEAVIIGLLFVVSFVIYNLYQREMEKSRRELRQVESERQGLAERLDEAFKHIGQVNVQIQEVEEIFGQLKKYPESKSEFKGILAYFAEKVLGIVDADWVLFRIVDAGNLKTLREYSQGRGTAVLLKAEIDNADLVKQAAVPGYSIISSTQTNLNIKAYCVLPKKAVDKQVQILLKAIVGQLEMMFLIYASGFLKNGNGRKA